MNELESIDRIVQFSKWKRIKTKINNIMFPPRIFTVNGEVTPLFTTKFKIQLLSWILFLLAWTIYVHDKSIL